MDILIISGLSGAGKSKAASYLEDMGFYIVDNMPAVMILKFAEFCAGGSGRYDRVALVYDVRTASSFAELFDVLDKLRAMEGACRMLFLEAEPEVMCFPELPSLMRLNRTVSVGIRFCGLVREKESKKRLSAGSDIVIWPFLPENYAVIFPWPIFLICLKFLPGS